MLKYSLEKTVQVSDWDRLVESTYGKPYCFQQQDGCVGRGFFYLNVPNEDAEEFDSEMNDKIPVEINGEIMGVKFDVWQNTPVDAFKFDCEYQTILFWERNFYPNINSVANDLHKKGLIEAGTYTIIIDW
jgi:hypothetical protein